MRRTARRVVVALAVWLVHRALGAWLVGVDPLAELLDGDRLVTAAALSVFVPLRLAAWFVVVPWAAAGALADLADGWAGTPARR